MDVFFSMVIVCLISVQTQVTCAQIPVECQGCGCCAYGQYRKCDNKGNCNNGCQDGYWGDRCNYTCMYNNCLRCARNNGYLCECRTGYYGFDCEFWCGTKCDTCDKTKGCISCIGGYWGRTCNRICYGNCVDCRKSDGKCNSCVNGYWGRFCYDECGSQCKTCNHLSGCTECNTEYYGSKCEYYCGTYCASCDEQFGCTACIHGYWNDTCDKECHTDCLFCNQATGSCLQCKNNAKYGPDCRLECSTNCKNTMCNIRGNCTYGCILNMYGNQCENTCAEYCTPKDNKTLCSETTGMCSYGCETGYIGAFCPQDVGKTNERQTSLSAALGGGLGGGSAFLIIIVIAGMFWFRKRRRSHTELDNIENNDSPQDARRDYDTVDTYLPEVELNDLSGSTNEDDEIYQGRRSNTEHNDLQNNDIVLDARRDYDTVDINLREVELNDLRYEILEVNEVHTMDQTADYSSIPEQENDINTYENIIGGL